MAWPVNMDFAALSFHVADCISLGCLSLKSFYLKGTETYSESQSLWSAFNNVNIIALETRASLTSSLLAHISLFLY